MPRSLDRRAAGPLNYRHAFHAGNAPDVFKHTLLTRILVHLARKPAPFCYLDTHAGPGWYDLAGEEARRGGEWQRGIGRLDADRAPAPVRALLDPYLAALGSRDAEGRPRSYPGSPGIAAHLLRPADRMVLCELHPADGTALRAALWDDRRATVLALDGYVGLKATLPPPERRGLVLIDPPFEAPDEFTALAEGLRLAHRRWATGIYALWYPIKDRLALTRFAAALEATGIPRMAQVELVTQPAAFTGGGLAGSGLILVNPPFGLDAEAALLLPWLAAILGEVGASWRWRVIAGE